MKKTLGSAVIIVVGLGMIGLLYLMAIVADRYELGDQIALPLLAISGVVLLISVLALAAVAFSLFEMNDKAQALGLPEGSVRAVIALSLVLLFAILSVYLYGSLATAGTPIKEADLAPAQAVSFLQQLPNSGSAVIVGSDGQVLDGAAAIKKYGFGSGSDIPKTLTFSVYYTAPRSQAADDFARQLLVMIGTLVTSVAGFYFGSKAAGAAQSDSTAQRATPALRRIDPDAAKITQGAVDFSLEGDSLNQIVSVKIVSGDKSIPAQQVISNNDMIKCNIDLSQATQGNWDVVATDSFGKSVKLVAALKIAA